MALIGAARSIAGRVPVGLEAALAGAVVAAEPVVMAAEWGHPRWQSPGASVGGS
jgi:hypothetical protein